MRLSIVVIAMLLAACGTNPAPNTPEPDREIFVVMRDDFSYDPAEIEVTAGEIISFQVANKGAARHEFLIGTPQQHENHESQMEEDNEHAAHKSEPVGVSVDPGMEKIFTFVVPKEKELLFGCHEPGHFEKGMKGNISYRD